MARYGFGNRAFGTTPFGESDWCKIVLYDELPGDVRQQDVDAGGPYLKFVEAMCPSFTWLKRHLDRFKYITNPREIREDLLLYLGENFGIEVDLAEPLGYQRMRAGLAARWNIIKGILESYVVLCRVHGFEVDVHPLWWDGIKYLTTPPVVGGESPTYQRTVSTDTRYKIWLKCAPAEPSSVVITIAGNTITDDGDGKLLVGLTEVGTIDYGWGYADLTLTGVVAGAPKATYQSVVGGCVETCRKCKTHRIRLEITTGAIGGQSELTIADAFKRMWRKIGLDTGDGVVPIHVELEYIMAEDTAVASIGHRYDILADSDVSADSGFRAEVVS